jgi:hypothetical protein
MYTLVTFTPVELGAITHYLSSVVPRSTLEQDELFELMQRLRKTQEKINAQQKKYVQYETQRTNVSPSTQKG